MLRCFARMLRACQYFEESYCFTLLRRIGMHHKASRTCMMVLWHAFACVSVLFLVPPPARSLQAVECASTTVN
jgi:hypothetical protein